MVSLTTHELRLLVKNRGIKNYKNMSKEKLLSTLDELERNFKTLSEKRNRANRKNAESITEWIKSNHKNA